jgi:hypothetical protein
MPKRRKRHAERLIDGVVDVLGDAYDIYGS